MLKTISPLISPDLLKVLAEMGHGDEIIFSDAHFPANSMGPQVIRADHRRAGKVREYSFKKRGNAVISGQNARQVRAFIIR